MRAEAPPGISIRKSRERLLDVSVMDGTECFGVIFGSISVNSPWRLYGPFQTQPKIFDSLIKEAETPRRILKAEVFSASFIHRAKLV